MIETAKEKLSQKMIMYQKLIFDLNITNFQVKRSVEEVMRKLSKDCTENGQTRSVLINYL